MMPTILETPTPSQEVLKSHGITYCQWRIIDRISSGDTLELIQGYGFHFYEEEFYRNDENIINLVERGFLHYQNFTFTSTRCLVHLTPKGLLVAARIRHNLPGEKDD